MTSPDVRDRLYGAYSTTHAGVADQEIERRMYLRDIKPHLPTFSEARIVDIGCGQGELVRQLTLDGYVNAYGIDISPEQVMLAQLGGVRQVRQGDFRTAFDSGALSCVTATDFFEHLTRDEVLEALDRIATALAPGGRLIARMPNAVSPFSGNFQHGDLTHETAFTPRSFRQATAAAGFSDYLAVECPPFVHSVRSRARSLAWKAVSGAMKAALAVETGPRHGHIVSQNFVAIAVVY